MDSAQWASSVQLYALCDLFSVRSTNDGNCTGHYAWVYGIKPMRLSKNFTYRNNNLKKKFIHLIFRQDFVCSSWFSTATWILRRVGCVTMRTLPWRSSALSLADSCSGSLWRNLSLMTSRRSRDIIPLRPTTAFVQVSRCPAVLTFNGERGLTTFDMVQIRLNGECQQCAELNEHPKDG